MDLLSYPALALSTYSYQYGSGGLDALFCAGCTLLGSKHIGLVNSVVSAVAMLARYLAMAYLSPVQVILLLPLESYARLKPTKFSYLTIVSFVAAAMIMANVGFLFLAIAVFGSMHSEKDFGGGLLLIAAGVAAWSTKLLFFEGSLPLNILSVVSGMLVRPVSYSTIQWSYPLATTAMFFVSINTHAFSIRDLGIIPLYFAFARGSKVNREKNTSLK